MFKIAKILGIVLVAVSLISLIGDLSSLDEIGRYEQGKLFGNIMLIILGTVLYIIGRKRS